MKIALAKYCPRIGYLFAVAATAVTVVVATNKTTQMLNAYQSLLKVRAELSRPRGYVSISPDVRTYDMSQMTWTFGKKGPVLTVNDGENKLTCQGLPLGPILANYTEMRYSSDTLFRWNVITSVAGRSRNFNAKIVELNKSPPVVYEASFADLNNSAPEPRWRAEQAQGVIAQCEKLFGMVM